MSKGDRLYLAQHTTDDQTLKNLATIADEGDKSVLSALFARGYMQGYLMPKYEANGLVTVGNFSKLKDDILFEYLRYTLGNYGWRSKFPKNWEATYKTLLKGRESLTLKMMDYSLFANSDFYKAAVIVVSPERWTNAQISQIWGYAPDPDPLIHRLSKPERITLFNEIVRNGNSDRNLEVLWLFDCTRAEIEPLLKANLVKDATFINSIFGRPWGEIIKAVRADRWSRSAVDLNLFLTFFQKLSREDILFLEETTFKKGFIDYLENSLGSYPGGSLAYISDIWRVSSNPVHIWLFTFLPSKYIDVLQESVDASDPLHAKLSDAIELKSKGLKVKAEEMERRYSDINSMSSSQLLQYFECLDPDKLVDKYALLTRYSRSSDIDICVARRASVATLAKFLTMHNMFYYTRDVLEVVLPRLRPGDYLELLDIEVDGIQAWVGNNIPPDELIKQVKKSKYKLISQICNRITEFSKTDKQYILSLLEDRAVVREVGPDTRDATIACIIRTMPDIAANYIGSSSHLIQAAAVIGVDSNTVVSTITASSNPIINGVFGRDDFAENAPMYLNAHLERMASSYSYRMDGNWQSSLIGFDEAVLKMSDDQFKSALGALALGNATTLDVQACIRSMRPFGPNTVMRIVSLKDKDLYNIGQNNCRFILDNLSLTELTSRFPIWDMYRSPILPLFPVFRDLVDVCFSFYVKHPVWLSAVDDADLVKASKDYELGWGPRGRFEEELRRRQTLREKEKEHSHSDLITEAITNQDPVSCANLLWKPGTTALDTASHTVLTNFLKSKSVNFGFKMAVVQYGSKELLDFLWEFDTNSRTLLIQACPKWEFDTRLPGMIEYMRGKGIMEVKGVKWPNPSYVTEDTRTKASMIERADSTQTLDLFKYYYEVQGTFGPKVREAFLEKLDLDSDFKNILLTFLLSKEFKLRKKQFTLDMIPIVTKIDSAPLNEKFNGSGRVRSEKIGSVLDYWDGLKTQSAKEKWLDETNNRSTTETLLQSLVERAIPLSAPLDTEFTLGTNDSSKTSEFLNLIKSKSRTITHKELFSMSLERASDTDIRGWLLSNPLRVFDFIKPEADASKSTVRIDAVANDEHDKIEKFIKDTWKGADRGIKPNIKSVFKVVNPPQKEYEKRKNPTTNVKTLIHGTHYFAAGLIIQNHFKVMTTAKSGRMLGDGIYFTDCGSKSAQYISGGFGVYTESGAFLICEVDLGNCLILNDKNDHQKRSWNSAGYDSVYWPKKVDNNGYGGRDAEYAIADVSRIRVLYVVHLERVQDRSY